MRVDVRVSLVKPKATKSSPLMSGMEELDSEPKKKEIWLRR